MADPTVDTSVAWYKNVSIISHIFQAGVGIVGLVVGVLAGDFHMSISPILAKIGTGLLTVGGLLGIYHNTSNE